MLRPIPRRCLILHRRLEHPRLLNFHRLLMLVCHTVRRNFHSFGLCLGDLRSKHGDPPGSKNMMRFDYAQN
jgi:hypothetical protein